MIRGGFIGRWDSLELDPKDSTPRTHPCIIAERDLCCPLPRGEFFAPLLCGREQIETRREFRSEVVLRLNLNVKHVKYE